MLSMSMRVYFKEKKYNYCYSSANVVHNKAARLGEKKIRELNLHNERQP